jgi:hypothetical protein
MTSNLVSELREDSEWASLAMRMALRRRAADEIERLSAEVRRAYDRGHHDGALGVTVIPAEYAQHIETTERCLAAGCSLPTSRGGTFCEAHNAAVPRDWCGKKVEGYYGCTFDEGHDGPCAVTKCDHGIPLELDCSKCSSDTSSDPQKE